jgi:hypothetical protein
MRSLFVAWQDPNDRQWHPVGKLVFEKGTYVFAYTKGAKNAGSFTPFAGMPQLNAAYLSEELFPFFANRLLAQKRPEYGQYKGWLNLPRDENDPLVILGRTGGIKGTDSLEMFPCPQRELDGKYRVHFFTHGLRHLLAESTQIVNKLKAGDPLFLMLDIQNTADPAAISIRTGNPALMVGYVPRYFTPDLKRLVSELGASQVMAAVERVNSDAPLQFRLLCSVVADWPINFHPFSQERFEPLVDVEVALNHFNEMQKSASTQRAAGR